MPSNSRILEAIEKFFGSQSGQVSTLQVSNSTRHTTLATYVEVAGYGEARRKGLLGRKHLPQGEGLWIKPCEAVHTIGMQFPIDLVFLDKAHRVKKLRESVVPWRISSCLTAYSVLELPAGTIAKTQTQIGDSMTFSPLPVLQSTLPPDEKLDLLLVEVQ